MQENKKSKNLKIKKSELEKLKEQSEEYLNGWKRAQADYQNLQRETAKQKADLIKMANENLILSLLPVLDNFKMAFNQIPEAEMDSPWVVGFSHIKKQLEDLLAENGVEQIKTVGEPFNPEEHEAVEQVTDEKQADNLVVQELRPGYRLNTKVVQVAKVVVNNL